MKNYIDTRPKPTRAILVAVATPMHSIAQTKEHLDELSSLCRTLGIEVVHSFTQHLERSNPKTLIGKGKIEEIKEDMERLEQI